MRNFRSTLLPVLLALSVACAGTIEADADSGGTSPRDPAATSPTAEPSAAERPGTGSPSGSSDRPTASPPTAASTPLPSTSQPSAPQAPTTLTPTAMGPAVAAAPGTNGIRGIFNCPTIAMPVLGAGGNQEALSTGFKTACSACHGPNGEGKELYPAIPGKLDEAAYIQIVRKGGKAMPLFTTDFISDAELKKDFAVLSLSKARNEASAQAAGNEWSWTDAQVKEAYSRGMVAFRKPDPDGAACANCHSPDALDLAVIGFPDDSILRRAHGHVSQTDALAVRDLVHAQRRLFNIKNPCSPDWRPFQPGGEVLPGNTPDEQDASFAAQLKQMGLLVATGRVVTIEDARRARDELTKINLKQLRIGIPLPRWTEDAFRGPDHKTINDHMPAVPHIPNNAAWYAKQDAYLANPTDAAAFDMIFSLGTMTNDGGYLKSTPVVNACGAPNAGAWISHVSQKKYEGGLLMQHYMRMALTGKKGWESLGPAPYADLAKPFNPWFNVGGTNAERVCPYPQDEAARPLVAKSLPKLAVGELSDKDLKTNDFLSLSRAMAHSWMTFGLMFDQSLFMSEGAPNNKLNYWVQDGTFLQKEVHLPFMYLHRVLTAQSYKEDPARIPLRPKNGQWYVGGEALPLLDGQRLMWHNDGTTGATDPSKPVAAAANRIRGNLYRTILLLQKELLQAGKPCTPDGGGDGFYKLTYEVGRLGEQANKFAEWNKVPAKAKLLTDQLGADVSLYGPETTQLVRDVLDLIAKAPKTKLN